MTDEFTRQRRLWVSEMTPCYQGPMPGFGFCRHPDCRIEDRRRQEAAVARADARGTPPPRKSRRRCVLLGTP